ncbi:D-Ala-D-Ala carboxypeptidase family metallohydrolase [Henriciella sp.]|uniref:D-Ala-D-Ala carboxypeptidase family metallohydrolase n=1 Tax=Henriciella sp. TaxID=1968823 RepID=UPI0026024DF0|nr:D-Ala-D-Ala carboxypeptidase family metallohydrolase [Henriciella sp.]
MLYRSVLSADASLRTGWCWPHFSVAELACRCGGRFCGGEYWHAPGFLDGLETVRAKVRAPLIINSGHRCAGWNAAVGGAPLSQHKTIAADIRLAGHDRFTLLAAAEQAGFTGLGLARSFLHIDRRARPARWFYPGSETVWKR